VTAFVEVCPKLKVLAIFTREIKFNHVYSKEEDP
jgi:hypothetical protein